AQRGGCGMLHDRFRAVLQNPSAPLDAKAQVGVLPRSGLLVKAADPLKGRTQHGAVSRLGVWDAGSPYGVVLAPSLAGDVAAGDERLLGGHVENGPGQDAGPGVRYRGEVGVEQARSRAGVCVEEDKPFT